MSSDGPKSNPRSEPGDTLAEHRQSASLERAASLVVALMQRALRHERVLEVLDLRTARAARQLAGALRGAASRWASATDSGARSEAASELLELMDAAEAVLLFAGPAPSERRDSAIPASSVTPVSHAVTEPDSLDDSGVREVPSLPAPATSPKSDQSFWQAMLGTSRGRSR